MSFTYFVAHVDLHAFHDRATLLHSVFRPGTVSLARVDLMVVHNRLIDYLGRGIVPDDLKQSG
jgi:hypothetical protein